MSELQKFRIYFGKRPAAEEELSGVEEINVEQQMDMAWQATIKISLCLDERGNWQHGENAFFQSLKRLRVEVQVASKPWLALIDGPIVGRDSAMDSQPGRSSLSLTVHDDSAFLNREGKVDVREGADDDEVVRALLGEAAEIVEKRVEKPPPPSDRLAPARVRRGTLMQQLRELAKRHEFHVFVLPGAAPGQSIGCFLPDPQRKAGLPDLVLLGGERNLYNLQVSEEFQSATRFRARTLTITDKQIVSRSSRLQELDLLGPKPAQPAKQAATQVLPPEENNEDDPARAVAAATRRTSYSLRADGRVIPGCYDGVLQPYQLVTIRAGTTALSGDYLLTKVTHRITPSIYSQEFSAKRNGVEESGKEPDLVGGIL